jgi:hypothetical protein
MIPLFICVVGISSYQKKLPIMITIPSPYVYPISIITILMADHGDYDCTDFDTFAVGKVGCQFSS